MSVALIVPTLEAGAFRLRPFTLADIDGVREASSDPHIPLITTVPAAFTEDEGRRFIERQWSRSELGTGYSFAIADAGSDRAVGQVGLWLKDISEGRASVGYWVAASARGRGAAAFAVQILARWAHRELQVPRLELYVEPWNTASIRTAERSGFQREGLLRSWQEVGGMRKDMYMYSRLQLTRFRRSPEQSQRSFRSATRTVPPCNTRATANLAVTIGRSPIGDRAMPSRLLGSSAARPGRLC